MRADAHYVEQLDSSLFSSPIRFIEVRAFDSLRQDDELGPSAAFVESIRRIGKGRFVIRLQFNGPPEAAAPAGSALASGWLRRCIARLSFGGSL